MTNDIRCQLESLPGVFGAGSEMQPAFEKIRGAADSGPVLTEHELDQEWLYRVWADGRLVGPYIILWTQQVDRLQLEAPCDYLTWLLQRSPPLKNNAKGFRAL